jgi:two-component system response regulator HydG
MLTGGRVLVVDDEEAMCRLLEAGLTARGFQVRWFTSPRQALDCLDTEEFDVILTDLNMDGMSGLELCRELLDRKPHLPVTVLTAHGSFDSAVAAIRAGAYDFITKPPDLDALELALRRAVQHKSLRGEVKRLREAVQATQQLEGLLGQSPVMKHLFDLIERLAPTTSNVLLTGESGTGKELVAHALHARGPRRDKPFVVLNCAAVPEALLESELFGHKKGSFTDARQDRVGLFAQADGGTLFLDEVGEMPLALQPKLLRALQERKVRPLGSTVEVPIDVRIVAATNRELEAEVEAGRFREDLFFRLNVIPLELPPLRARASDVLLLAQHFVEKYAAQTGKPVEGISAKACEKLLAYTWPGNVRELQNCLERAVALTRFDRVSVEDLPERVRKYKSSHVVIAADDPSELVTLEVVERRYIERVLEGVNRNMSKAARILGIDRTTLYRKLERYGQSGEGPATKAEEA